MQSLTSAIGDKMADVAKELEMSLSDDLLEQFYKNGGDDIELAQCLRAVEMKELAKRLVYATDNQSEACSPASINPTGWSLASWLLQNPLPAQHPQLHLLVLLRYGN